MTHRFLIWLIVTLYVTYSFSLSTAAAVFSDAIKGSLNLSTQAVSGALTAYIISFACSQIPAGYLLDKFNPRWVVSSGLLILSMGNFLTSYANSIDMLVISNLIQGVGGSFAFIASGVLIANWFSAKSFPIMFGLTQSLSCILSGIFHYKMMLALEKLSWKLIYHYLGIVGITLCVLSVVFIKRKKVPVKSTNVTLFQSIKKTLKNSQIMLCAIATATSFGALLAYASYWYMNIQKYYSVNASDAFIIGGMIFAGIGIGTPFLGWLSNKACSRVMIIHSSLVLGVMALLAGIYLPHFNIQSFIIIKSLSFMTGFLLSGSMLLYTVVSENTTSAMRGVALSVTNTGVFLVNTLMMFLPIILMVKSKNLFFTYLWIFPFVILIAVFTTYFIKETYDE